MNNTELTAIPNLAYTDTPVLTAELELNTPTLTVEPEPVEDERIEPVLTVTAKLPDDDLPNFVFTAT